MAGDKGLRSVALGGIFLGWLGALAAPTPPSQDVSLHPPFHPPPASHATRARNCMHAGGIGGSPNGAAPAYVGIQTSFKGGNHDLPYPGVHAPWYGYLVFAEAAGLADGGRPGTLLSSRIMPGSTCGANIKVWPLLAAGAQQLRVLAVNKDPSSNCSVVVRAPGAWGDGSVARLATSHKLGWSGAAGGITWKGQTYEGIPDGVMHGEVAVQPAAVTPLLAAPGGGLRVGSEWRVELPAASAALLTADRMPA